HAFSNSYLLSSDSECYLQEFVDCLEHWRRSLVRTLELHNLNAFFIDRDAADGLPAVLQLREQLIMLIHARLCARDIRSNRIDQRSVLVGKRPAGEDGVVQKIS